MNDRTPVGIKTVLLRLVALLFAAGTVHSNSAQTLLNGGFEVNYAPSGLDQIDLDNEGITALVPYFNSFGFSQTAANLNLITTAQHGGPPLEGSWFAAVQGGGAGQFSLALSQPLIAGATYYLTFYDRAQQGFCSTPVQIGISNYPNEFGLAVFQSPEVPTIGVWKARLATFTVPFSAEYITVRAENEICWIQVDDFCLDRITSCIEFPAFLMPNVFSPNGDGLNDVFEPISFMGITQFNLTVTNRWGNVMYTSSSGKPSWNGTHNERDCPDGVYFWMIEFTNIFSETETRTGSVSLFRDQ